MEPTLIINAKMFSQIAIITIINIITTASFLKYISSYFNLM